MIDWTYLIENYPNALKKYMSKGWSVEEFWEAYEVYVNLRLVENESGSELWDWKVKSKLIIYSSLCYKSIMRDGKKISVLTFNDLQEKKVNEIFELIEKQIENKNFENN